VYRYLP